MATSYLAKSDATLSVQLKVQEVCVKLSDSAIITASGSTVTVNIGEQVSEVRSAIFLDDSAGTAAPVTAANQNLTSASTGVVVFTLSAAMASADSLTVKYTCPE